MKIQLQSFHNLTDQQIDNFLKLRVNKKIFYSTIIATLFLTLFFGPILIIFVAIVYFSLLAALKEYQRQRKFMSEFAKENNFEYRSFFNVNELSGRLFKIGNSRSALHTTIGKYNEYPLKIFNYSYTVGSGKRSTTYRFTVCEISIENIKFPHIFLKSDSMWRHAMQDYFGQNKDIKISLEKEFDEKFDLYCTQDYETEVLQIFTKDLLGYLIENGNNFSIEFAEDKIYFYDDLIIKNKVELDKLYDVVKKVLDNSGELIKRLSDDFDAMHNSYRKN